MTTRPASLAPTPRQGAALAVAILAGYTAVAFAVDSFYPFSVFPMYARPHVAAGTSRIAARTGAGEVVEVTVFDRFACDARVERRRTRELCGDDARGIPYVEDELGEHVNAHAGEVDGGEPVDIVKHVYVLGPRSVEATRDCVVARCRARRGGP